MVFEVNNSGLEMPLADMATKSLQRFPLIAIVGPTAVGKTAVSIRLAQEIRGEIVNFDSVQIYKYLDIGSAKPTLEERSQVPHHLFDIVEPNQLLDVASYVKKAVPVVEQIVSLSKTAILTGGTGLYLKALLEGLSPSPGWNPAVRAALKQAAGRFGSAVLVDFLSNVDQEALKTIHPNDVYRLIRAAEVFIESGRPISWWWKQGRSRGLKGWPVVKIGLIRPREELYRCIEQRVDQMMVAGFLQEVKALLEKGYDPRLRPLRSLGYRHMIMFLTGRVGLDEAVRLLKRDTRRYAKRQITWFKADPLVRWFHPERLEAMENIWAGIHKW